ncbi:MAG: heavy metal-binding domain-containing protein [Bacteroidia bacterium]|nr:MAG: heavy metal-binding domain-containing protein [Bacteroidia bacterium]
MEKMVPLYNTENIPGQKYELIGLVKGTMIQSKHLGKDIGNALKSIVGGELRGYSEMLNEARALATKRLMQEAIDLNADAVVNLRYTTSAVKQGVAEILAYGTAVKFV